jgi:hypothetical protein
MHPVDNPGQPAEKGRTKKTLGSPPEKGGKKKNKKPGINLGQPAGEGRKKKKKQRRFRHRKRCPNVARRRREKKKKTVPVLPRNAIGRTGRFCRGTSRRTDGRTDYVT